MSAWSDVQKNGEAYVYLNGRYALVKREFLGERERDSYGDVVYGSDSEVFMVVKDSDGNFWKKFGYQSSYSDECEWDGGALTKVKPQIRTITVWE